MGRTWPDIRYAAHALAKSPGVTIVAIVSLALGIGANTAVFSLLNALILRPLPVSDPQQLVEVSTLNPRSLNRKGSLSVAMFEEIRKRRIFSSEFAWSGGSMDNFETNGVKYAASLDTVSGDYFSTLGIQSILGRLIEPADVGLDAGSSSPVAVISYRCWQNRYHADPAVIGKTIRVANHPLTIIGVAPQGFSGMIIDADFEAVVPMGFSGRTTFRERQNFGLTVFGRLKPGSTLEQARAQLQALWPAILEAAAPDQYQGDERSEFLARRVEVTSAATGNSYLRPRFSRPLMVLLALVGSVLLIACVNLANLMLARAAARKHEIGIRIALGANRWQLVRQFLTESLMLSLAGAALGLVVALWSSRLLLNTMWTGYVPVALVTAPDGRVLAFTAVLTLLTGILSGLAPAWRIVRGDLSPSLRQGKRTVGNGLGSYGKLLVIGQVSLSFLLVIGAGLFVRTLEKLRSTDPGFRRAGVLLIQMFPQAGSRELGTGRTTYYRQLAENLTQIPGIEAVSYSQLGPATREDFLQPVSVSASALAPVEAAQELVGPAFFDLIGMRLLHGRDFAWRDDEDAPRVAILSESLAQRLFPAQDPIGRTIDAGAHPEHKGVTVVGVVGSASLWKIRSREPLGVYLPLMQQPRHNNLTINLRATGDPLAVTPSARRTLETMGHHYPLRIETLEKRVDGLLNVERITAMLATFFGGLALLLASIGLYALVSHAVTMRTSEIGVRMALGARPFDVLNLILKEVLLLVLTGMAIGLPLALAAAQHISEMLFDLGPSNPETILVSGLILLAVGLFAGYLPARRASNTDPMTAVRCE